MSDPINCSDTDNQRHVSPYGKGTSLKTSNDFTLQLDYYIIATKSVIIKPQSHRIVRFLGRTIGWDWAKVRPLGNVCYDLQQRRIPRSISTCGRAFTNDWRISMAKNRATSGSDQRSMYDQSRWPATDGATNRSLHPATDRTSNRGIL